MLSHKVKCNAVMVYDPATKTSKLVLMNEYNKLQQHPPQPTVPMRGSTGTIPKTTICLPSPASSASTVPLSGNNSAVHNVYPGGHTCNISYSYSRAF